MKKSFSILLIVLAFASTAYAEGETPTQPVAPTAAGSEQELNQAFQREYVYLASQKESLRKQKAQVEQNFNQRIAVAKGTTNSLQKELVSLTAQNDEDHEYMMSLERRKKDLQKKGSSMESTYKKAEITLTAFEAGLRFEQPEPKAEVTAPDELKFEHFDASMEKALEALQASARVESFEGSFLDMNDQLVQGQVTRIGRSAAIGSTANSHFVLGPNGSGLLKALEASDAPGKSSLQLYVFESMNKVAKLKKQGGFTEKLADFSPLIFLGLMLLLVAGLFSVLIKV